MTQRPLLKAASSRRSAWRDGSLKRPSCGPGGFWSGSRPSRTNNVRRCTTSFANLSPFSHAVPIRGSGSPNQLRAARFICGRRAPTGARSVEGPAKDELRRAIVASSHPPEPMVNQRRLPDASPSDDSNDVYLPVCPRFVYKGEIVFSTKNITPRNRQSGYGDLLWSESCWRSASCDTRSGRGCPLQALTSDSTPCVDSACYRRNRLQQLVWSLKTLCWIFLKEFFNENDNRLWNIFESLER